jgi:TolB-like protein
MKQLKAVRSLALVGAAIAFTAAPVVAQDARPTVAILYFENSTFGKANADYQPLSKGIADLLISSMANNDRFRVVERDELQAIMQEQNLAKTDNVDKATAVKIGKLLNAHHLVTGGFISDPKGNLTLTARAIEVETSRIEFTESVKGKQDDIMSLIDILAEKMNSGLKLKNIELNRVGDASPVQGTIKGNTTLEPATAVAKAEAKAEGKEQKLDFKAAVLYSKALNQMDSGNKKQAEESFKAVLAKFPEFAPAKKQLSKLQTASGE